MFLMWEKPEAQLSNPGLVEILVIIYLQLKEDCSQDYGLRKKIVVYNPIGSQFLWQTFLDSSK